MCACDLSVPVSECCWIVRSIIYGFFTMFFQPSLYLLLFLSLVFKLAHMLCLSMLLQVDVVSSLILNGSTCCGKTCTKSLFRSRQSFLSNVNCVSVWCDGPDSASPGAPESLKNREKTKNLKGPLTTPPFSDPRQARRMSGGGPIEENTQGSFAPTLKPSPWPLRGASHCPVPRCGAHAGSTMLTVARLTRTCPGWRPRPPRLFGSPVMTLEHAVMRGPACGIPPRPPRSAGAADHPTPPPHTLYEARAAYVKKSRT